MNVRRSILIVDDHQSIRDPLATFMRRYDFDVDTACDGLAMRQLLKERSYDLIILDVMLPGEDGLSLCGFVTEHIGTPVILLTAMTDQADRVAGLEIGADDYVLKPFDPRELVARVRSVLRRGARRRADDAALASATAPEAGTEKRYAFEGWSFDLTTRELHDPSLSPVPLTTAEFHLLRALLENPNRVLSRQQLMDLTQREGAAFFDRSIDTQISRLRKKLESDPRQPRMLKTVRGDGYLLAARSITLAP
ncbi:two-component system OmpR family response regulator [Comamonas sp. BIGb0152]|uniref:response regulator n=1 Tax=Comamonas sp. BIGb0152 TaxID=2940601 RepID=UPI0021695FAD|nr:response regulator transcription factor [Comamonas sp. BIGb0152]MCS4295514.1 two-component system OmpR family response regulator [Comamonas sp. BIGb0152]